MKALHISVEASLKKLRTDYIDILYLHWWDYNTSVEEVMNGLHNLVVQGKVLYLVRFASVPTPQLQLITNMQGVSDTPAWIVSKANLYARMMGKTPFVIYQGAWSILMRDFEREILPMALSEGLALAPWNVLAGGKIRSDAEEQKRRETGEHGRKFFGPWERNDNERKVCNALEKVAQEVGVKNITSVAIAYVMQKAPYVFPIIGGRKVEHFHANLEALDITLTPEQIAYLEGIVPFDKGFPQSLIGDGSEYTIWHNTAGHFDKWPRAEPIRPAMTK
ncbi:hypothetical protein PHLCEN_2v8966 [Hermanssonia centrifuga]|uniref:NADP-dependent oxidoreductase domain-containing protein n=1 Tax=Hermanssonia centrifuga TaxID=98765 RepID=A0A2R6NS34_9APHY|nr:hypothetical protein PHLCEN_2v8966 [Hermanssonia centrifuga]